MGERYYIYAIAASDSRLPENVSGFGDRPRILPYGELGAVVSRIGTAVAGGTMPPATAENLLRHEAVVEAVCAGGEALPVRFGTELADEEAVMGALATQYATLQNDLRRIGGKLELGVTALWRPATVHSDAPTPSPDVGERSGPDTAPADGRPGLAYLRARQAEHRRAESLRERAHILARELDVALRPLALECHRSLCPSEHLALRDVYLIERERIGAFEGAFDEVRKQQQEVRLLLSGPWPPYSFVTPPARHDTDVQGRQRADRSEQVSYSAQ